MNFDANSPIMRDLLRILRVAELHSDTIISHIDDDTMASMQTAFISELGIRVSNEEFRSANTYGELEKLVIRKIGG